MTAEAIGLPRNNIAKKNAEPCVNTTNCGVRVRRSFRVSWMADCNANTFYAENASATARIFKGSPGKHKNTRGPVTVEDIARSVRNRRRALRNATGRRSRPS